MPPTTTPIDDGVPMFHVPADAQPLTAEDVARALDEEYEPTALSC